MTVSITKELLWSFNAFGQLETYLSVCVRIYVTSYLCVVYWYACFDQ